MSGTKSPDDLLQDELIDEILETIYSGMQQFNGNIMKFLMEANPSKNLAFSPVGCHLTLSMTSYGAAGGFESAFGHALGLPSPRYFGDLGFRKIVERYNKYKTADVVLKSSIFVPPGLQPFREFIDQAKNIFQGSLHEVDFSSSTASSTVNNMARDKMVADIADAIAPTDVNKDSSIVLVNASYFKSNKFEVRETVYRSQQNFIRHDGTSKKMTFLSLRGEFTVGQCIQKRLLPGGGNGYLSDFIMIPFAKPAAEDYYDMSMVVICPPEIENTTDKFKEIESTFNQISTMEFIGGQKSKCHLLMPQFRIKFQCDLKPALEKLHMDVLYDPIRVYFRKIMITPDLILTKAAQTSFMDINGGVESKDDVSDEVKSRLHSIDQQFIVNRPFYILILETTDFPVIKDPTKKEDEYSKKNDIPPQIVFAARFTDL